MHCMSCEGSQSRERDKESSDEMLETAVEVASLISGSGGESVNEESHGTDADRSYSVWKGDGGTFSGGGASGDYGGSDDGVGSSDSGSSGSSDD